MQTKYENFNLLVSDNLRALISCVHYDVIAFNKLRAIQKIKLFIIQKDVVRQIFVYVFYFLH